MQSDTPKFTIRSNTLKFPLPAVEDGNAVPGITLPHWVCMDGVATPNYFTFFIPSEAYAPSAIKFGDFADNYTGKLFKHLTQFLLDAFSNPHCGSPKTPMVQPSLDCGPITMRQFRDGTYLSETLLDPLPAQADGNNQQALRERRVKDALAKLLNKPEMYTNCFQADTSNWKEKVTVFIETVVKERHDNKVRNICQENIAGIRIIIIVNDLRLTIKEVIEKQLDDNRSHHQVRLATNVRDITSRSKSERHAILRNQAEHEVTRIDDVSHIDLYKSAGSLCGSFKVIHSGWYGGDIEATNADITKVVGNWLTPLLDEEYTLMLMEHYNVCPQQKQRVFIQNPNNTITLRFSLRHLVVTCPLSEFNIETFFNKMFPFTSIRYNDPFTYSLDDTLTLAIQRARERIMTRDDRIKEHFSVYSTGEIKRLAETTKYDRSVFHLLVDQARPFMDRIHKEALDGDQREEMAVIKRWVSTKSFFFDYVSQLLTDPTVYASDAMRAVITYHRENFIEKKNSVCVELNRVADNISTVGSWLATRIMRLDSTYQIISAHGFVLLINDSAMLVWTRLPMHNHIFASGAPGHSKSYATKLGGGTLLIPGTWRIEVGSSNLALFNESGIANSQHVINLEEMGDVFFRSLDNLDKEQSRQRQMLQALITDSDVSFRRSAWKKNPKDPKHSIGISEEIYPYFQGALIGSTNRHSFDAPMDDRAIRLLTSENYRNLEGRDSHNFINHTPSVLERQNISLMETEYRNQQLLCAIIFTLMELNILAEIPMDQFNIMYDMALSFLYTNNLIPKLSDRVAIRARNLYKSYTVLYAIYMHFHSELSPFRGKMRPKMSGEYVYPEFDFKNFELSDLKGIDVYFAPNEERVMAVLAQIFSLHIREVDYLILQFINSISGKFNVNTVRDYVRQYHRNRCAFNICGRHGTSHTECKLDDKQIKYINYMSSNQDVPPAERLDEEPDGNNESYFRKTIRVGKDDLTYSHMLVQDRLNNCSQDDGRSRLSPMLPLFRETKQLENFVIRETRNRNGEPVQALDPNYILLVGKNRQEVIDNIVHAFNSSSHDEKAEFGLRTIDADTVAGCLDRMEKTTWTGPYVGLLEGKFSLTLEEYAELIHPSHLSSDACSTASRRIVEVIRKERNHYAIGINIHVCFRDIGRWVDDLMHSLCHKYTRERDIVVPGIPYKGYPQLYRTVRLRNRPNVIPSVSNALYRPIGQTNAVFNNNASKRVRVHYSELDEDITRTLDADTEFVEVINRERKDIRERLSLVATTSSEQRLYFDFDMEAKFTTLFNLANRFDDVEAGKLNHAEIIERRIDRLYGKNNDPIHPNDAILKEYLNDPFTAKCYAQMGRDPVRRYPDDFTAGTLDVEQRMAALDIETRRNEASSSHRMNESSFEIIDNTNMFWDE